MNKFYILKKEVAIYKYISKYELDEIEVNGNSFFFVIEIYLNVTLSMFFSKTYRKDFFKLKSSFTNGQEDEVFSDDQLMIEDATFINEDIFEGEEDALKASLERIKVFFEHA